MKKRHMGIIVGVVVMVIILVLSLSPKSEKGQNSISNATLINDAESAFKNGKILKARDLYRNASENITDTNKLKKVQEKLDLEERLEAIRIILKEILDEHNARQ